LKISTRFFIIGGLVLLFVGGLVGVSFWGFSRFNTFVSGIEEDQIPEILSLNEALEQVQSTRAEVYSAILASSSARIEALLKSAQTRIETVGEEIGKYTGGSHPIEEKDNIARLAKEAKDWESEFNELIKLAQTNTLEADKQAELILEQDNDKALLADLEEVVRINEKELLDTKEEASATFFSGVLATVAFGLVVLAIVFSALWLLARSIIQMTNNINKLNQEISRSLSEKNREFGEITSTQLKSIVTELRVTSTQQANRSQEQALAVLGTTSSLGELAETSRQIASNSGQVNFAASDSLKKALAVNEAAQEARLSAERGQEMVVDTVQSIEIVREGINEVAQRLQDLTERSGQISSIINLIKDISDETHLLSLNAAIESAGAGEYGQRFGVVANEVKNLADRSLAATKEVNSVIKELQSAVNAAVVASEDTRKQTFTAVAKSYQAGEVINELGRVVEETADSATQIEISTKQVVTLAEGIGIATQQQESAVRQIITLMEGVKQVAQENASAVSQISSTVSQVDQISSQLKEVLTLNALQPV
jgi:methyl-accepting chemotaxis protein